MGEALKTATSITVRFTAPGFHQWPAAPQRRAYLRERHRHLFHVAVTIPVLHADREVEFHDLQDAARELFAAQLEKGSPELRADGRGPGQPPQLRLPAQRLTSR
jgi:hypothetical protein